MFISLQIIRPLPAKSCDNFHEVFRRSSSLKYFFTILQSRNMLKKLDTSLEKRMAQGTK